MGASPDIYKINEAVSELISTLRQPPAGSELARQIDAIDISLVKYYSRPELVIDWCRAPALPLSVQPFAPTPGTFTGLALEFALQKIQERLQSFHDQNVKTYGMPHIIHITDGAPTDLEVGSRRWNEISEKLSLAQGSGGGKKRAHILHYVTPNGCVLSYDTACVCDETGRPITGEEALSRLTGPETVYTVDRGSVQILNPGKANHQRCDRVSQNKDTYVTARREAGQTHGKIKATTKV